MNMFIACNLFVKSAALASVLGFAVLACASEKPLAKMDPVVPKSMFVDDVKNGKDPFFPNSIRRQEALPRIAVTNEVAPVNLLFEQLFLKGISGIKGQQLALINSSTLATGEVAEIKFGGRSIKVRCREIRERSVLIELDGSHETRELKLREGI
ncbi:MAG TPA: hypothetical protein VNT99_01035 [Methylomirabilota bacterium]|nr:hypothetical protein [Methylomirabilota bacterium]